MQYALVENNIVTNLIVLLPSNADDFPNAVPIGDKPISMGDTYNPETGKFYRNGSEILSPLEEATMALQIILGGGHYEPVD